MNVRLDAPPRHKPKGRRRVGYAAFVRRIERLINLIAALLESRRPLTAEEIREQIAGYDQETHEAFRRAFERDKEALRAMGVPLEVRPTDPFSDQADGYFIDKSSYYLPELDLAPDEVAALRLAADSVLGAKEQAGSGLLKLSMSDLDPTGPSSRIAWGADVSAEQPVLGPLYAALLDRTPIAFTYETADGGVSQRKVEPYGLVHRRGNWYLVANDRDRGEPRTFKAARITSDISPLEGTYDVPEGFDASARVAKESWESGAEEITATVRFDADLRWWVEQNMARHPQKETGGGAVDVELPVSNVDAFLSWIIEFAGQTEIVAPESLRSQLCARVAPWLSTA